MRLAVAGISLVVFGTLILAAGIALGIIFPEVLVPRGFFNYHKYEEKDEYEDPLYEDCENETFNAFFFNITNAAEVLAFGATPFYQQVGPYNYTREVCKFNITNNDKYEYFKRYYKPFYLKPANPEVSEEDLITNFNPGYLGVIKSIEAVSRTNQETVLVSNLVGSALDRVIRGMQTPSFLDQAKVLGIAMVLSGIRDQVVPALETPVRATAAVNVLNALIPASGGAANFFNNNGVPNGVATYLGATQTYTDAQLRIILNGTGAGEPLGWLTELQRGLGLLNFLTTVGTAAQTSNVTALQIIATSYTITIPQLTSLLQYVTGRLLPVIALQAFGGNAALVTVQATNLFYGQWANSSLFPSGLDITGDGVVPDGFELNTSVPTNISLNSCYMLWDSNNTNSLLNMNGIIRWFNAALLANAGNLTELQALALTFGLNQNQISAVTSYLVRWQSTIVEPFLLQSLGLTTLNDLCWLQWGTGVLEGRSIAEFDPSVPAPPEFSYWAAVNQIPLRFNVTRARSLLNGTSPFLGTSGRTPQFFALLSAQQFAVIEATFGLNATEALIWAQYLNYMMNRFIDSALLYQVFPAGGGPLTTRRPRDILWEAIDPLLLFLRGNNANLSHAAPFYDENEDFKTRQEAELGGPLWNDTIFLSGSKDDMNESFQKQEYEGLPYVPQYQNLTVSGNKNGRNFVPGWLKKDKIEAVWFDLVARPVPWKYSAEIEIKGIKLWQFRITDEFFQSKYENPDNAAYFQEYHGFVNITAIKSVRSYLTLPHFRGVDPNVQLNANGLNPNNSYYEQLYFGTHQASGISMVQSVKAQLVYEYPPLTRFYNITRGGFAPIMWRDDYEEIEDDDADTFKSTLNAARAASIVCFVVGIVVGVVSIGAGAALIHKWRTQRNAGREDDDSLDMRTVEKDDQGRKTKDSSDSD